jgi:hypothetical protein
MPDFTIYNNVSAHLGLLHERGGGFFAILPICNWNELKYNYKAYLCINLQGGTKV